MAEFFGATTSDGRSETSMVDSMMMPILHSAMNRAHDKVRSSDASVLQRLAEQSKFCDLAVMQLDVCVSCLQSADDDRGFQRQSTVYCKLVSDLTEIRDRLLGRLRETERAIADKDKELQRLRNWVRNQRSKGKEQLKDEKNFLEERKKADLEREKGGADSKSKNVQDCDHMGSEINSLKKTLDVAMLVMQNSICVSDVRPFDVQFCWEMEKDIMTSLFAGIVRDFQLKLEEELVKSREEWSLLGDFSLSGLKDDLMSLRCDLASLAGSMDDVESKNLFVKNREEWAENKTTDEGVDTSIMKAHKLDFTQGSSALRCKETDEHQRSIQRLIKKLDGIRFADKSLNHEKENSVAEKSRDETSLKEKDTQEIDLQVELAGEFQTILISNMMKDFEQHLHDHAIKNFTSNDICMDLLHETVNDVKKTSKKTNMRDKYTEELNLQVVISGDIQSILLKCALIDFQQHTVDRVKGLMSQCVCKELLHRFVNDVNKSSEEKSSRGNETEELKLQLLITGEVQNIYLRCVMADFQNQLNDYELMNSIEEVVCMDLLRETIKHGFIKFTEQMTFLKEELFDEQVFQEALKCIVRDVMSKHEELRNVCDSLIASETRLHIESDVRKKVYTLLLKEIGNTLITEPNEFRCKNSIEKEVYQSTINDSVAREKEIILDRSLQDNLYTKEEHPAEFICDSEHEVLMIEENKREMDFNVSCNKFGKASTQPGTSKMTLKDLRSDQVAEISDDGNEDGCSQKQATSVNFTEERKVRSECLEETKGSRIDNLSGFGFSLKEFCELISNLENGVHQKLDINICRLQRLKDRLLHFKALAASLRRKELQFRQAFIRRCENLQKAETEVDHLGDQVNALLSLIERIYGTIQYHAPALQQCSGVLNILTLIKKELNRVMV